MIYTNEIQSKKLLERGIDKSTADLQIRAIVQDSRGRLIERPEFTLVTNDDPNLTGFSKAITLPSWSYDRLLELLTNESPILIKKVDIEELINLITK